MSTKPQVRRLNAEPTDEEKQAGFDAEAAIAAEAAEVRGEATELTSELWLALRPLLLKPFHSSFIVALTAGEGKPYASTGIRSVHVQQHRMDAVLTPFWWRETITYSDGGKLCHVRIDVGTWTVADDRVWDTFFTRESWGGVDRGTGLGNLYKGSYTNAAKRAYAAIGPGQHVYMGAADLDPDTDPDAAKAQASSGEDRPLSAEGVQKVLASLVEAGLDDVEAGALLQKVGVESPDAMRRKHALELREIIDARPVPPEQLIAVREAIPEDFSAEQVRILLVEAGVEAVERVDEALAALTIGQARRLIEDLAGAQ